MTEQNKIKREYTINEYVENFILFSTHFGRTKQGGAFQSYLVHDRFPGHSDYQVHPVNIDGENLAEIKLTFEIMADGQLKVTAVMSPIIPANPLSTAALQYLEDMDKAIHLKYKLDASQKKARATRKSSKTTLVYGGLIKWYADASDISIDDAAHELEVPKSRYYNDPSSAYTDQMIAELGTSFDEVLEKHHQGDDVLLRFLREKFRKKSK